MRTQKQRGGFWPFTSSDDENKEQKEETIDEEEQDTEDKGEGGSFFSGLFGSSNPNATTPNTNSATGLPEMEPRGPALPEESQAGGAKKRRTLRKRKSIRKSHKKSRKSMKSQKSRKSRKSLKHQKKH